MTFFQKPYRCRFSLLPVFLIVLSVYVHPVLHADDPEDPCKILHAEKLKKEPFDQGEREVAIHDLARRDTVEAAKCLVRVLDDPFIHIRQEAVFWMQDKILNGDVVQWLATKGLKTRKPEVARNVLRILARTGSASILKHVKPLATVNHAGVREQVVRTVRRIEPSSPPPFLRKRVTDRDPNVSAEAIRTLGILGDTSTRTFLLEKMKNLSGRPLAEACLALGKLPGSKTVDQLRTYAGHDSWRVRMMVLRGLLFHARKTENYDAFFELTSKALEDANWHVEAAAIDALVRSWKPTAIKHLIAGYRKAEGRLIIDYRKALRAMTGEKKGGAVNWASWWHQNKSEFELGEQPDNWRGVSISRESEDQTAAFFDIPLHSKRMMFVMDFSGGMDSERIQEGKYKGKTKLGVAKHELLQTIKEIKREQRFNILIYRYYSTFPPKTEIQSPYKKGKRLFPASLQARKAALKWVSRLKAEGWGAFYEAFRAASDNPNVNTIVFLSDGKPTRGKYAGTTSVVDERFFEAMKEMNRYRQLMIHTVLTGSEAGGTDAEFLKKIADHTGGYFQKR